MRRELAAPVVACLLASTLASPQLPSALLINLPKHTERYQLVSSEFEAAGIRYERAEAVDGRLLSPDELKQNVTLFGRCFMTPGMIGCFLSHRKCWQRCVDAADGPMLGALPPTMHKTMMRRPPTHPHKRSRIHHARSNVSPSRDALPRLLA